MTVQMTQAGIHYAYKETKKEWEKLKANSELSHAAFMVSKEAIHFLATFEEIKLMVKEQGFTIKDLEPGVTVNFKE